MARMLKPLAGVLLGGSIIGFAQQRPATLESLFSAAQQAQVAGDYATAANDYQQAAKMRPDMPEIWANLGLMQQETGNIPAAIEAFQKANRLNPSLYVPNLFLGIDYAHTGKPAEAIPLLSKAEKSNPADPQAPLALGRAYISARNYSAAIPKLDRALTLNPKLGTAWFDLGIAQLDQVESDARTISEENKQSPFAGALYAESLMKQARYGEAASLYKSLLDAEPQPPCIRSELGFALIREHDEAGAASTFADERTRHPECGLALLGQARIALDRGDNQQAINSIKELWNRDRGFFACNAASILQGLRADEESALVTNLTGEAGGTLPAGLRRVLLAAINSPDECAIQPGIDKLSSTPHRSAEDYFAAGEFGACARALESNPAPTTAAKLRLLAACSFFSCDNENAARAASALRTLDPHSLEALYWSIEANERLAFQSLARFQQLDPDSARSHVLLGDIYQQLERFDDAQAEYQKALSLAPSDPAAMLGLASAYLSNYNSKGAMTLAQNALSRTPDDPELNLIMGQALLNQREYAEAEPYLKKSLNAKPQMLPRIHALIGKVYAETGRTKEAIGEVELGASSDEDGSVHYLLARLYRKLGDTKDAQIALQRMETIKKQREARGVKRVEDPDLTPLERSSAQASAP
ncbi:MAG: tetratricopeptide repeat protein [Terracidiphilus sp.]